MRGVTKSYGGVRAVDCISLVVERGEFLTLLGPSGCGKTSLLNMIAGFFPPSSGRIVVDGQDVTDRPPYLRDVGVVFQNYALFPHMTVAQNVAFGLEERRHPKARIRERVDQALTMVRLEAMGARRPAQLSGGQQQRVALARALVIEPRLLLLDEPLSALDKNLRTQMQIEIRQIQRQTGVTAVFVTHDQAEALSLSDRVAVLNQGRIEQLGTAREIYGAPRSAFVASFVGETNVLSGVVGASARDGLRIDLDVGAVLFVERHQGRLAPGCKVDVFVRPEDVAIVPPLGDRLNVVTGIVSAHSYQGSFTHVVAGIGSHRPILMTVPGAEVIDRHPAGTALHMRLDLNRAVILEQ